MGNALFITIEYMRVDVTRGTLNSLVSATTYQRMLLREILSASRPNALIRALETKFMTSRDIVSLIAQSPLFLGNRL